LGGARLVVVLGSATAAATAAAKASVAGGGVSSGGSDGFSCGGGTQRTVLIFVRMEDCIVCMCNGNLCVCSNACMC
jgi:hypothetical protein